MDEYTPSLGDLLLKEATRCKNAGQWDDAITTLTQAYVELAKYSTIYPIETYIRLPMYLHQSGRKHEAWNEFNKLLATANMRSKTGERVDRSFGFFDRSHITDKLRLCFQRDGKYAGAVKFGIISMLSEMGACKLQQSHREFRKDATESLKYLQSKGNIENCIESLLKKTGKTEKVQELYKLVRSHIQNLPDSVNFNAVAREVDELILM